MKPAHHVVITGIGMITPVGLDTATCWRNLLAGQSGIRSINRFNPGGCRTKIGGELPEEYSALEKAKIPRRMFKQTLRATRLGFLCAQQAVED
ncbi:ketosynthase chain-length factor, partial [candidate division KSB3 bacterium]|nr:ketosynthase chain-length factor [candidate division KSB3 bacterium]MBD3323508.1 ketosynthase chain-length factor [candidate division KSB3 bacterium]